MCRSAQSLLVRVLIAGLLPFFGDSALAQCPESNFCTSGPSSLGVPALMSSNGACGLLGNALELRAGPVPNSSGQFYVATAWANGGQGTSFPNGTTLCVNFANATSTGPQQIANNQLVHQANFNASHFSAIGIGTTLYFQASYTDPGQVVSSNFSDGLQITFQQETSPSIGFQGTSSSAIESIGTASIGMQVSSASGLPISVDVQYSGSATRGVDFNGPDSLTLPPGQTVLNLDIQVLSDALYEFDEQVVIDLIGVTNAQPGSLLQHVLTLANDDPQPTVEFQSATSSSAESVAGDSVRVMMSAPSGVALELPYTLSGTALLGLDYTDPGGGLLTIPAGNTFALLPLIWVADGLDEPTETIAIQLGTPVNGTLGTQQDHVLSLLDSDPEPTVSFVVGSSSHLENAGSVAVQIQLSEPSGFDISVPFSISGSATQGADFGVGPSPMTLLAGTTSVEVLIALSDDLLDEANETVVLTLGAASHAVLGAPTVHVLTIEDDDLPPEVRFLQASSSETEGTPGDRVIGLEITSLSGLDVSIDLSLAGTASNGVDYVAPGGTVLISAGSLSGQVFLPILDDTLDELDETIELNLTLPVNAILGSPAVHVHRIIDDDATPTPGFVLADSDLNEGQSDLVEVSLTAISGLDVSFALGTRGSAVSGSDYTPLATTHVIPAGSLALSVPVEALTDGLHEGDETIALTIPVGATPGAESHALLIHDQDAPPVVQFAAGTSEVREDHGVLVLPLVLSGPSAFDLTLAYALSGSAQAGTGGDFLDQGQGVVTVSAFETTGKIGLEILQDGLFEYREDLVLDLMSVNPGTIGALSQHLVALVDDDPKPRVSFATAGASYLEGAGVVDVDLVLEGPASFDFPVAYTFQGALSEGLDFQIRGPGMVRIPAGQSTASFQVELLGDLIDELDEELVLRLMPGDDALIGAQQEFLLVALDDDAPPVIAFDTASASALESAGSQLIGMSLDAPSGLNVTGSVSLGGTAIDGSDFSFGATTFTIPAGSLSADLTLTPVDDPIDELGETVELTLGGVGNAVIGSPSVHTFTLLDDDAAPVVQFDLASSAVLEGAGVHAMSISLDVVSGLDVTLPFTVNGTAVDPADFGIDVSPVVIAAGAQSVLVNLTLVDDLLDELDETVVLGLGIPINATLGLLTSHTATITDNDAAPVVQFDLASSAVLEGAGVHAMSISLDVVSGLDVTVPFTVNGTAVDPADFGIDVSPVVIASGAQSVLVNLTVVDDLLDESDETVVIGLGIPSNATLGSLTSHTATITDNDVAPVVQFDLVSSTVLEGAGAHAMSISLDVVSGLDVTVPFTVNGTAVDPADFGIDVSPVVIASGAQSVLVNLTVVDDLLDESDETVVIGLGIPSNATLGSLTSHTATITDNDAAPVVQFDLASSAVLEGAGVHAMSISLDVVSGLDVTVPFTVNGTAVDPADFGIDVSPVVITAGSQSVLVNLTLVDDLLDELDETVVLGLGLPSNATLGSLTSHTATITDNDSAPVVQFDVAVSAVDESSGAVFVSVSLGAVSGLDVEVPFTASGTATDPDDYSVSGSPLVISAGSTSVALTLTIVDDLIDEAQETVLLTLGVPVNASLGVNGVHAVRVDDNDAAPVVQFDLASSAVLEGAGVHAMSISLDVVSGLDVTVPFTVNGTAVDPADYGIDVSPVVIAAGTQSMLVNFTVVDDLLDESDETVVIGLGLPSNATLGSLTSHTATITDNDSAPVVQFDLASSAVLEGAGAHAMSISLDAVSGLDVTVPFTVNGTAVDPADFGIDVSPVVITAGSQSMLVNLTLVDDLLDELDETVVLGLGLPSNATLGSLTSHTATITDNDAAPVVQFDLASSAVLEGAGVHAMSISLDVVSGLDVTVPFTVNGTAVDPADFGIDVSPVVIASGAQSVLVNLTVVDDLLDESDETVVIGLGIPSNATLGSLTSHTATITDNDVAPVVQFDLVSSTVLEGAGAHAMSISLDVVSGLDVTVPFTVNGTAVDPADFGIDVSPVVITAGSQSVLVNLTVVDDLLDESDETVVIGLGIPSNATLGSLTSHTATITDNDVAPVVQFDLVSSTVLEGAGAHAMSISLDVVSGLDVTVPFTVNGTAVDPADFGIDVSPVVIAAGSQSVLVNLTLVDDLLDELDETVVLGLGLPSNATLGSLTSHTATITDNDSAPVVQFDVAVSAVDESSGAVFVSVSLGAVSGFDVEVPFTASGTATDPDDYSVSGSPLVISAGSTSVALTLTIVDDLIDEAQETVLLTLGVPVNASLGVNGVHAVRVDDNDSAPVVQFDLGSSAVLEGAGAHALSISLDAVSGLDVTVPFTVNGTAVDPADYGIDVSPVVIAAGTQSMLVNLTVVDDLLDESDETVVIGLGLPSNATLGSLTSHTATITDNDSAPVVQFDLASSAVLEGAGAHAMSISLDAVSGLDVTVPFTVNGTAVDPADYGIDVSPVVIASGAQSVLVNLTVVDDLLDESDETVVIGLGIPSNATLGSLTSHTATITDNDSAPVVQFDLASSAVLEGAGAHAMSISLDAVSGLDVTVSFTVNGTAVDPADFGIDVSPVVITAGSQSVLVNLTLVDDLLDELDETVVLGLGLPSNATLGSLTSHTATITDNDSAPVVQFDLASSAVLEGAGVHAMSISLDVVSGLDVTVPFTVNGTAVDPADFGIDVSPVVIASGAQSVLVNLTVVDDLLDELDETVVIGLGIPSNATLGSLTSHTATITDNDAAPVVQFDLASSAVLEGAGAHAMSISLDAVSGLDVTVPFTVNGTAVDPADFGIDVSPVVIASGAQSVLVNLTLVDDLLDELDETAVLGLGIPINATLGLLTSHTATITDNDAAPVVQFSLAISTLPEAAHDHEVTLTLDTVSGLDVTVPISFSGTATDVVDYGASAVPLMIPAGSLEVILHLAPVDDLLDEPDETIIALIGSPVNATVGGIPIHTSTLVDDDAAPSLTFVFSGSAAGEAGGIQVVEYVLSAPSGQVVSADIVVSGTAIEGQDFNTLPAVLSIPTGDSAGSFDFSILEDQRYELAEDLIIDLVNIQNGIPGVSTQHTLTITDNDPMPTASFTLAQSLAGEGNGQHFLEVQLDAVSGVDAVLSLTLGGSAVDGADYSLGSAEITVLAGQSAGEVTVTLVDDLLHENDESILVTLASAVDAALGGTLIHDVTLVDDDDVPVISFELADSAASEAAVAHTIRVVVDVVSGLDASAILTLSGTATDGADYSGLSSAVLIPAGSLGFDIPVTLLDDVLDEFDETLIVSLSVPVGADLGVVAAHTLTLADDDATPTVDFALPGGPLAESSGVTTIVLTLSAVSGLDVSVPLVVGGTATTPEDYSGVPGTVEFPAGSLTANLNLALVDDLLDEADETIGLSFGDLVNGLPGLLATSTLTVLDDDEPPVVGFDLASSAVPESDGSASVSVSLDAPSGRDIHLDIGTGGTATPFVDYNTWAGTLLIPEGELGATLGVSLVNDLLNETDETIVLTVTSADFATVGALAEHTVTITDDDLPPVVGFSIAGLAVDEGDGVLNILLDVDAPSGLEVRVPFLTSGTAVEGLDYSASATEFVFPAGVVQASVLITLLDDELDEFVDTLQLDLAAPTNAALGLSTTFLLDIADNDDPPVVEFISVSSSIQEDGEANLAVTIGLFDASGTPIISGRSVRVSFSSSGIAVEGEDYSLSQGTPLEIPAGSATFDLIVSTIADVVYEDDEDVHLLLGVPVNATLGLSDEHVVTILNDDALPEVSFLVSTSEVPEGVLSHLVEIQLSGPSAFDAEFDLGIAGDATLGLDYGLSQQTGLVIPAGGLDLSVIFTGVEDLDFEGTEHALLTLQNAQSCAVGPGASHEVSLLDNEARPDVEFALSSSADDEGVTVLVDLILSAPVGIPVTIDLAYGGAASGGDASEVASVTFLAQDISAVLSLDLLADGLHELPEDLVMTLQATDSAEPGILATHTLTINDLDPEPVLGFLLPSQDVIEDEVVVSAEVVLSTVSGRETLVSYSVSGASSADTEIDFSDTISDGLIVIPAGQMSGTIQLQLHEDALIEVTEYLILQLDIPDGAVLDPLASSHEISILDDDDAVIEDEHFNVCGPLPPNPWVWVDAVTNPGDYSYEFVGVGSSDAGLVMSVTGGVHVPAVEALPGRLSRPLGLGDFQWELRWDSDPDPLVGTHIQGLLLEVDGGTFLRCDVYRVASGAERLLFIGGENAGTNLPVDISSAQLPVQLRISHTGTLWAFEFWDGLAWQLADARNLPSFNPVAVSLWAGNHAQAEAFTATADFLVNSSGPAPFDGDDGPLTGVTPSELTLSVSGLGNVTVSPEGTALGGLPEVYQYWCDDLVSLTPVSDPGWLFDGWLVDGVPSAALPLDLVMDQSHLVDATFIIDTTPPVIGDVVVQSYLEHATISWTTSKPSICSVAFGVGVASGSSVDSLDAVVHSVVLPGLVRGSAYLYQITATDSVGSSGAAIPFDGAFSTGSTITDDFNQCDAPQVAWSLLDPNLLGSMSISGQGTDDAWLRINVLGGNDVYPSQGSVLMPPQVVRAINAVSFEHEIVWDSVPDQVQQIQGVLYSDDGADWVRADLSLTASGLLLHVSGTDALGGTHNLNATIAADASLLERVGLRVARDGDLWTVSWSLDGLLWTATTPFALAMQPVQLGLYAGTAGGGTAPGFTAIVDYVANTLDVPLAPEDGPITGSVTTTLFLSAIGLGQVDVDPAGVPIGGAASQYFCGETVSMTATPDFLQLFTGWIVDGAPVGNANPLIVDMGVDHTIVAVFDPDTTPPVVSNVQVVAGLEGAFVSWETSLPSDCVMNYGLDLTFGSMETTANGLFHSTSLVGLQDDSDYFFEITATALTGIGTPEAGQFETATRITEDFNLCGGLGAEWTFFDPQAAGSASSFWLEGGGTADAHLVLSVPSGAIHNAFTNDGQMPARMRRTLRNTDFVHEFHWDTVPSLSIQDQGVLYEEDDQNFVRVDFFSSGGVVRVYGAQRTGGTVVVGFHDLIAGNPTQLSMRVERSASVWTVHYSTDGGVTWLPTNGVERELTVNTVGLYVGNAGTNPAFDAHVDWVANGEDTPITGEDGAIAGSILHTLTLATQGTGTGVVDAIPAGNLVGSNPSVYEYWCEPTIEVEAVPSPCSIFVGWTDPLLGSGNPVTVDLTSDLVLTAIFDLNPQIAVIGPVSVETFGTTARMSFITDLPATMSVDYGLDATVSLGTLVGAGLQSDHEFVLTDLDPLTTYHYLLTGVDGCGNSMVPVIGTFDTGAIVSWTSVDFNHPNLDQGLWSLAAMARPGQLSVVGAGSGEALLNWEQTGGESLSPVATPLLAPLVQFISDADMDVEVSLTDIFNQPGVSRGFEASNSAGDWVRFFAEHSTLTGDVVVRIATRIAGSTVDIGSPVVIWTSGPGNLDGLKLRVSRDVLSDAWEFSYSTDGSTFSDPIVAVADLIIEQAGPFVAATGLDPVEGVRLQLDYVFDVLSPIIPEDGGTILDLTAPWIYAVDAFASGETTLRVDWGTEEASIGWIEYGTDPLLLDTVTNELPLAWTQGYTLNGLQPGTTYYLRVSARDQEVVPNSSTSGVYVVTTLPIGQGQPPVISVWNAVQNGNDFVRRFGDLGTTQKWLNLQGRIEDLAGEIDVSEYRLNGGPWLDLKLGKADPIWAPFDPNSRLFQEGDFCIEIDSAPDPNEYNSDDFGAIPGSNLVEVRATDDEGLSATMNINFEWNPTSVWPGTYSPDFASIPAGGSLDEIVQLVDGEWTVGTNPVTGLPALQNMDEAYDRLFDLGDPSWVDYDVAMNITVHHINVPLAYAPSSNVAAIGFGLRWNGHELHPWNAKRPREVWQNTGAFIQYRWGFNNSTQLPTESWRLWQNDPSYIDSSGVQHGVTHQATDVSSEPQLVLDVPMNVVGSTRTRLDGQSVYLLHAWAQGTLKPDDPTAVIAVPEYGFDRPPGNAAPRSGGALVLVHHANASIDSVSVVPYPDPSLLYQDDFEIYSLDESNPAFYIPAPWEFVGQTPTEDVGWSACFHEGSPLMPVSGSPDNHNRELLPALRNNTVLGLVLKHGGASDRYHATYKGVGSELWGNYEFSGRFYLGNQIEKAAPMFLIQAPAVPGIGGSHYRFGKVGGGSLKLVRVEVTASGSEITTALNLAGMTHVPDQTSSVHRWSKFRIQALDDAPSGGTLIRLKAWFDDEVEPTAWVEHLDDSPSALTRGSMGFWGYTNGERFLDDIRVKQL